MALTIPKSGSGRLGVNYDDAHAEQVFELGYCDVSQSGDEFVYVRANGAISQSDVVLVPQDWDADQIDTTNSASAFGEKVGVAFGTLADNQYGWVLVCGVATEINVGSSCAANAAINSTSTAGRLDDDGTAGTEVVDRLVLTTTESSGNVAPGVFTHPTVGATLS